MVLRKPYENNVKTKYGTLEGNGFFSYVKEFSKETQSKEDIKNSLLNNIQHTRVWLLFGKHNNDDWECLQVGHSKSRAKDEIIDVVDYIYSEENLQVTGVTKSAFYEDVCPIVKKDYRKCLYGQIGKDYEVFRICFLNVDKYLGLEKEVAYVTNDVKKIVEICKNQYAEAKIAYETLAKYWRLYPSGIDGQTIAYFAENRQNFQDGTT